MSAPRRLPLTLLLLVLAAAGCDRVVGEANEAAVREAGEQTYIVACARCHQEDGEGWRDLYPPLAGNPIVLLPDPNPTIDIVLDGRGGMPGFRRALDIEELAQVISYIRQAWGNDAPPVTPLQAR